MRIKRMNKKQEQTIAKKNKQKEFTTIIDVAKEQQQ